MGPVAVLVADAQLLLAESLVAALGGQEGVQPLEAVACTGAEAVEVAVQHRPDVVVLDHWVLGPMNGLAATAAIREQSPDTEIVVLSATPAPQQVQAALTAGAAGFLPKSLSVAELTDAIHRARADTARSDGTSQYLPKLAVAHGGRLDVVYNDRRRDNANVANETSFQSSYDGGKKFTPRLRLSDRPFDSRIGPGSERNLPDLGNRLALLSTDQRALAVWPDTRAGTDASRKQDLVRAVVAIPPPDELAAPLRNMLRYGGGLLAVAGLALLVAGPLARLRSARGNRRRREAGRLGPPQSFEDDWSTEKR